MAHFAGKGSANGKKTSGEISPSLPADGGGSPPGIVITWSPFPEELGVYRRLLYKLRQQLEPLENDGIPAPDSREFTLTKEIGQLKRLLGEKVQEIDFFKGALQKVEARRRNNGDTGARASTTRSGK